MQSLWRWEVASRFSSCALLVRYMQRKDIFNGRVTLPAPSTMTTYTAASVWLVYGFVNPNGVDTFLMLSFLMVGECFYALAGVALKKSFVTGDLVKGTKEYQRLSIIFGLVGLLSTFAYDALTNFGSWIFRTGSLYQDFVFGNIIGVPFSIAHEASNVIFFATIAPAIIVAATRLGLRTSPDAA